MKKCPYCGREYPDIATMCSIDGEPLLAHLSERKKVNGLWRGVYGYAPSEKTPPHPGVPFTLKLEQGWLGHFTGIVTEDGPVDKSRIGVIDGYFKFPGIEFTKQMPVGYSPREDGSFITYREYAIEAGFPCHDEIPGPPIFYEGTFLDADRVQGTWLIKPWQIPFPKGLSRVTIETFGYWCAQFVTTDRKAPAVGGPTQAWFNKNLLPANSPLATAVGSDAANESAKLVDPEHLNYVSMGQYSAPDAKEILARFKARGLRYFTKPDDTLMRRLSPSSEATRSLSDTAQPIEIFIHPEDESTAVTLM